MPTKSYDEFLVQQLRDTELAAAYLSEAVAEGSIDQLLIALRFVAEAHGGIGAVAEKAHLNRQATYRALSAAGNPTVNTLLAILHAVGLNLTFTPVQTRVAG